MKKYILMLTAALLVPLSSGAQDIGGVISAGNAMVDVAKGIKHQQDSVIQVIELNSGQKIHVYIGNKSYFIDPSGNQILIPDGEYQDKTGVVHTFRDSIKVK